MEHFDKFTNDIIFLGIAVFAVALAGALFFTHRKAKRMGQPLWNNASRLMAGQLFYPVFAGGVFCLLFIYYGCGMFVVPACLVFYGLALISAARHTLSDIRYLGMLDVALGCSNRTEAAEPMSKLRQLMTAALLVCWTVMLAPV